jgi:hypothetical protein
MKRDGVALLQVLAVSGVGLAMFATLLPVALRSMRGANTSASKTKLDSASMRARFALSETDQCNARLTSSAPISYVVGAPAVGVNEITIMDPNTGGVILRGQNYGLPSYTIEAEYRVQSVQLQMTYLFQNSADAYPFPGHNTPINASPPAPPPPGPGVEKRYLANIVVTAQRTTNGGIANFLGSPTMTETIPILLQENAGTLEFCSVRSSHLVQIGPAVPYKSALECYDRDGFPVQVGSYYVCQIPYAPGGQQAMFGNECEPNPPPPPATSQGVLNYEGWTPAAVAPPSANVKYCI